MWCNSGRDCSDHVITVTVSRDATQCQCSCRNQWGSKNCATCDTTKFGGADCDRCADGLTNYPACYPKNSYNQTVENIKCQAKCQADKCLGYQAVQVSGQVMCSCANCPTEGKGRICALPAEGNGLTASMSCTYPVDKCLLQMGVQKCIYRNNGVMKWYNCGAC